MKDEFNPTKKDLLTIESLILDIKQSKNKLVAQKMNIQNSLSLLQNKYKDTQFNSKEFKKVKESRSKLKQTFNEIELKIKAKNDELIFKNKLKQEIEYHLKNNVSDSENETLNKLISKIQNLKIKYKEFAKDRTRIASLRIMANEFIQELENLAK
jgi:hypothetical protein